MLRCLIRNVKKNKKAPKVKTTQKAALPLAQARPAAGTISTGLSSLLVLTPLFSQECSSPVKLVGVSVFLFTEQT